ncbi:MAG: hypothetical protein QGF53_09465 [Alphaproteobacteria bacterium]|jgi:hypothetical protein|nr:hypothetical protein [Alphaproteobacteria bacterium]
MAEHKMKSRTKTVIGVTVAAVVATVAVAGVVQAARGYGGGCGGMAGKMLGSHVVDRFDSDGDGRLTQAEIDAARADHMARFDADGDGALTLQEFEGLFHELTQPVTVRAFQMLDPDGDASISAEELDKRLARAVARHDRNGDGALSPEDMRRGHWRGERHHGEERDDD